MPGRGRTGIWDRHNQVRSQRTADLTPEQRQRQAQIRQRKLLEPVTNAPTVGDWTLIDWELHECGYVPATRPDGKPLPKSGPNAEPAWRWTEEKNTTGRPYLRAVVNDLASKVYQLGHRHSRVELHNESGYPDDQFWGRYGPKLIIRELKAMRPDWKRGQRQHLLSLLEAGQDVGVWFPCCYLSGRIDEELAALAGVPARGPYARIHRGVPNKPLTWEDVAAGALDTTE